MPLRLLVMFTTVKLNDFDLVAAAFGTLRDCLFSSQRICIVAKAIMFEGLILSILLYGSECWSLTEKCMDKIRVFIARCLRNMNRVTRKHTREHRISNEELRNRAGLLTPDAYVMRHQLRWAGHVLCLEWTGTGCHGKCYRPGWSTNV